MTNFNVITSWKFLSMIQYIQELKKYDSADNINVTRDNINRLLDGELCAVDT